jgi:hypothetical protein
MKKHLITWIRKSAFLLILAVASQSYAGNPDRAGQAGGGQLLINPWARSSGMGGANAANAYGLEAQYLNVAGLAHTQKTELIFANTNWLGGAGININSFGLSQKVGEQGAIGLGIVSLNAGNIDVTTVEAPEGGIGFFRPQYLNLSLSYAKVFSNSIYGGINVKAVTEGISDMRSQGLCFDAGIQYHTFTDSASRALKRNNLHFGISLKNIGPQPAFRGDGLSVKANLITTGAALTLEQRAYRYDLPSLIMISGSYDFFFSKQNNDHRLTAASSFISNSFTYDQVAIGLEYGWKSMLMLRGGFVYEKGILNSTDRVTALTGPTAGFSFEMPFTKKQEDKTASTIALDYSFRATQPFGGCHSMGLRINL